MHQTKNNFSGFFRQLSLGLAAFGVLAIMGIVNDNSSVNTETLPLWAVITLLVIAIIVLLGLAYYAHTFYTKCPHCGKKMAMQTQNKQQVGVDYEQRQAGTEVKTYKVTTYHTHRICKFCKGEDYIETTKKQSWR